MGSFVIERKQRSKGDGEFINVTTPIVEAVFPKLVKPDRPKKDGKYLEGSKLTYAVDIDVLESEADEFLALIDELGAKAKVQGKILAQEKAAKRKMKEVGEHPYFLPTKQATDADRLERPGYIRFSFKMDAERTKDGVKIAQRPVLYTFDQNRQVVPYNGEELRNGAEIQVRGSVSQWCTEVGCGVSLRLNSVLIYTLGRDRSKADANSFAKAAGGNFGGPSQSQAAAAVEEAAETASDSGEEIPF